MLVDIGIDSLFGLLPMKMVALVAIWKRGVRKQAIRSGYGLLTGTVSNFYVYARGGVVRGKICWFAAARKGHTIKTLQ